jgi:DNA-binding GntR family transcriptional regulator
MDSIVSSAETAYEVLRGAVVRIELDPGEAVSEAQLAERFKLSKAAARAALGRLRTDGLVVAAARRGHTVAPLTLRDVIEIYDLRATLEPAAAARAAGHMPAAQLADLRALTAADLDFDEAEFLRVNRAVHVAVAEAGGNRRLAAIVAKLLDDSERARCVALRLGAADHGLRARAEHRDLLDAIERDDGPGAAHTMARAIEAFRDELVQALQAATLDVPLTGVG